MLRAATVIASVATGTAERSINANCFPPGAGMKCRAYASDQCDRWHRTQLLRGTTEPPAPRLEPWGRVSPETSRDAAGLTSIAELPGASGSVPVGGMAYGSWPSRSTSQKYRLSAAVFAAVRVGRS